MIRFGLQVLLAVVDKEPLSIPEIFYAVSGLAALDQKLTEPSTVKLVKNLHAALKKDDSLLK